LHRYLAEFDFRYSNRIKLRIDDTELVSVKYIIALAWRRDRPERLSQALEIR